MNPELEFLFCTLSIFGKIYQLHHEPHRVFHELNTYWQSVVSEVFHAHGHPHIGRIQSSLPFIKSVTLSRNSFSVVASSISFGIQFLYQSQAIEPIQSDCSSFLFLRLM